MFLPVVAVSPFNAKDVKMRCGAHHLRANKSWRHLRIFASPSTPSVSLCLSLLYHYLCAINLVKDLA